MAGCSMKLFWLVAFAAWTPEAKTNVGAKKKLKSLRSEFARKVKREETEYFSGASKILSKIAKLEEGEDLLQTSLTLGFAAFNDKNYEACAAAFEHVAKTREEMEISGRGDEKRPSLGLLRLGKFCKELQADRLVDGMTWCRQALPILEPEFGDSQAWSVLQFHFYSKNAELFDPDKYPGLSMNDEPPNRCSIYVPGLTPRTFHHSSWFPAARGLEENFARIAIEMDAFLANPASVEEMSSVGRTSCRQDALLVKKGDWRDIGLFKKGVQDRRLCWKHFPHTCGLIERLLPEVVSCPYGMASISRLGPGSDTMMHNGNTNAVLTMHLGIHTPPEAGLIVGKEKRVPAWERGKVTVFDDSFKHKVWHSGSPTKSIPRVVLLIRMWHPDLTLAERLEKTQKSNMITPEWLRARRMHLLNSSEASERWQTVSQQFRAGVGLK